ncbi:nuclear transport factor 2 family protein [Frankia sp. AgB1.9]|uniref:nuclear transport factor 2 family protein n=1 Tax=unclassified Frankia TaxID=2632575 RepID=UPI001933D084|nr:MULTISPECIES: nuclear transport factor 2 family protein [unclassified Frankia]MBL7488467.1 nuclear transport factor 2 family protein [Frankia sp. AgW1.1]MBL7551138.1 nuclear transport factor 2 family protein [Frankia sp. AgB1.9]MBL7620846.1 nuclear transport factor 2 family protein [Frankia sp. AgB1.8]
MNIDTIVDIEKIKQLKARYFRLMDCKQWDEWRDVFTEDVTVWVADVPDVTFAGRDKFVSTMSRQLDKCLSVHHGHMPEITVTGPDTATGVWAMEDSVQMFADATRTELKATLQGYGHYHEKYLRCDDGQWRIQQVRLHRLRVETS